MCSHLTKYCFNRKQRVGVGDAPDIESNNIETSYTSKICTNKSTNIRIRNNGNDNESAAATNNSRLEVAEEGLVSNDCIICPICLESFHIGEEVSWSNLGHCNHAFHHDCILPWAMLGNLECPVCREYFWSRGSMYSCRYCNYSFDSESSQSVGQRGSPLSEIMRQSRFCVQHGLILLHSMYNCV